MQVLQLCHKRPFPPADGGSIAMHQITQGLISQGHNVKVVALDSKQNNDPSQILPEEYLRSTNFEAQYIDISIKVVPAFFNLFTEKSYNVQRFYNRDMEKRLEFLLQNQHFDIIQLEGLYLTPYIDVIRKHTRSPILYRSHNIEHFIWERMAAATTHRLKKRYMKLLASRLKKYEMKIIHQMDGLVAISAIDLKFFQENGYKKPSIIIPVGVPMLELPDIMPEKIPGSVYHLGSMDWRPNQEGVEWFLENVWPLVIEKNPAMKFFLAGKNMPKRFNRYASDTVEVAGEVPDALAFFLPLETMVVPLLSGGGMRVKIIEGMAAAKTIVSTTIGAEGIGCTDAVNIFLADTPEQMANKILKCAENKQLAKQVGSNAKEFAEENYATDLIMKNLVDFYHGFYSE